MKHFSHILRTAYFIILLSLTSITKAQKANGTLREISKDSIEISLLTCGPGSEIYSLYGHTAIRFQNLTKGEDLAINYGMFSFRQRFFILRFVFGLTDYEMGIIPFNAFLAEYQSEGRWVKEQTLNLTPTEKANIQKALETNYLAENRTYRYNYFYDNCTTRARDILVDNLQGEVSYPSTSNPDATYRSMTHQWNEDSRWTRLGNDLLLGVKADQQTEKTEQQFLPDSLSHDFDLATINRTGGSEKLVSTTHWLIPPTVVSAKHSTFPGTPQGYATILLAIAAILIIVAHIYAPIRIVSLGLYLLLFSLTGLCGFILLAMIFSQHPTVSLNFQILILNPLNTLFLFQRFRNSHKYIHLLTICYTLFFILSFFQQYAEGIILLASCLLIYLADRIYIQKRLTTNR